MSAPALDIRRLQRQRGLAPLVDLRFGPSLGSGGTRSACERPPRFTLKGGLERLRDAGMGARPTSSVRRAFRVLAEHGRLPSFRLNPPGCSAGAFAADERGTNCARR